MQDHKERFGLLKKINEGLADIQKIEDEIASVRQLLSNQVKLFMVSTTSIKNTALIAYRQRLYKLMEDYITLEFKVSLLAEALDKVQP